MPSDGEPLAQRSLAESSAQRSLAEPGRQTPVWGEFDVVVLGGGPSGMTAASAAALAGCRTLLVEGYGFLGGMGTVAGVTNFCGLHANVHGRIEQVVHGLVDGLLARMRDLGGLNEPHLLFGDRIAAQAYDNAAFKIAADDLVQSSGAHVLFHAQAVGVLMSSADRVQALLIETKSGRFAVPAAVFIDCSGDGDLADHAGAQSEKGPDALLYPSTMFRVGGVDPQRAGDAWNHMDHWMSQAKRDGYRFPRKSPVLRPQRNPTEWRANVTQLANADGSPVDCTDAGQFSRAETLGRQQIAQFMKFLRAYVPGFEEAYLLDIAPQVGVRETRRIVGDYQLTERDVLDCASFPDTIGVNSWMIEEHVAGDVHFRWQDIPHCRGFNHLPYRMLLPRGLSNVFVAGRCASMTHGGQSAARVSGACFVMGQAAGTAAALAVQNSCSTRDVSVRELQTLLSEAGAYLGRDR